MILNPIRTEQDYKQAVARVESLISATRGTPKEDELDVLATLVNAYEENSFPLDLPDRAKAITFRMDNSASNEKTWSHNMGKKAGYLEVLVV